MKQEYAFSERRACRLMTMAVTTYRYRSLRTDEPLRTRLVELARKKPSFGYRRLHVLLRRSGEQVNHKRVHRVYREAGLASGGRSASTAYAKENPGAHGKEVEFAQHLALFHPAVGQPIRETNYLEGVGLPKLTQNHPQIIAKA